MYRNYCAFLQWSALQTLAHGEEWYRRQPVCSISRCTLRGCGYRG